MTIDFNFKVDKRFLAFVILVSKTKDTALANKMNAIYTTVTKDIEYQKQYNFLLNDSLSLSKDNFANFIELIYSDKFTILDFITNNEIFDQIFQETLQYKLRILNKWETAKTHVTKELLNILKLKKLDIPIIDVYYVHPTLNFAHCVESEYIIYGCTHGLKNHHYDNSTLIHELLHTIFKLDDSKYKNNYDMVHAIIELIADNELYQRLSTSKYSLNGHGSLNKYRKHIKPLFVEYLLDPNINIYDFITNCLNNKLLNRKILIETFNERIVESLKSINDVDTLKIKKITLS